MVVESRWTLFSVFSIRYFDFEINSGEAKVATNTAIGTCGRTVWDSRNPGPAPVIIEHEGVLVVRDDLFSGGTKARFLGTMFEGVDEVVYASPAEGGAQVALATVARQLGKHATNLRGT